MLLTVKSPGSRSINICELNVSNDTMFWKFFSMVTVLSISHDFLATLEKLSHDDPNFTVEEIREEGVNPSLSDSKAYTEPPGQPLCPTHQPPCFPGAHPREP